MKKNNYNSKKRGEEVFLVLVPHRDVRLVLRNYSSLLFKAGVEGAYHFPWVAPLAALSKPFSVDELKIYARFLREAVGEGKINAVDAASVAAFSGAEETALFGPRIDIGISQYSFEGSEKVTEFFSPNIIGACLLSAKEDASALPSPPQLSFRAAAVANMYLRTVRTDAAVIGYKWKIGNLCWLPKK